MRISSNIILYVFSAYVVIKILNDFITTNHVTINSIQKDEHNLKDTIAELTIQLLQNESIQLKLMVHKLKNEKIELLKSCNQHTENVNQESLSHFRNVWNAEKKEIAINILITIDSIFSSLSIKYHLQAGTLLGFARFGDVMPWDDDIDISVSILDQQKIISDALPLLFAKNLSAEVFGKATQGLKIFNNTRDKIHGWLWSHPFVDIWWDLEESSLPLVRKTFSSHHLPVPHNYVSILDKRYPTWEEWCVSPPWDHSLEQKINDSITIKCKELESLYNFKKQ